MEQTAVRARMFIGQMMSERPSSGQGIRAACARPRRGFSYRFPYRCSQLRADSAAGREQDQLSDLLLLALSLEP